MFLAIFARRTSWKPKDKFYVPREIPVLQRTSCLALYLQCAQQWAKQTMVLVVAYQPTSSKPLPSTRKPEAQFVPQSQESKKIRTVQPKRNGWNYTRAKNQSAYLWQR